MLASSVLGYWEYDGITVSVGGPGSASDPEGTWEWLATGSGNVDAGPTYIDASGQVWGHAWVGLFSMSKLGFQRAAYAHSDVTGTSTYHWVEDGTSKEITALFSLTVGESTIEYYGNAYDGFPNAPVTCSSTAYVQGGGNVTGLVSYYPYGRGQGEADTQGGSWADNDWGGVEAVYDYTDYLSEDNMGWYEGTLNVAGSVSFPYTGTPMGTTFSATASLNGFAYVEGEIFTNEPLSNSSFTAYAEYHIRGEGAVDLYGNIDDRE
jgi:hypothetical protein